MNFTRDLKLHDLILSFLELSRLNVGSKNFALIMKGIDTLWLFFLKFGMSQNNRDVTSTLISHSVSMFLLNAS